MAARSNPHAGPLTFEALADLYVADRGPDYHVATVKKVLGAKPVDAIATEDIEALRSTWLGPKPKDDAGPPPLFGYFRSGGERLLPLKELAGVAVNDASDKDALSFIVNAIGFF